ncbi:MAG: GNAT family N-acetyltransferase [Saprospiraceae bacterium]|nr:GNAT family N-acetyltransferase [Saprospiraceae bacterium]
MEGLNIRQAEERDLGAILGLVKELALYEKAPEQVTATLEDYKKNFREGVFEALVAEKDGEVVGMTLYYLTWSTWRGRMLYLDDFVVKSTMRGLGIGQVLFDALVQKAREMDCFLLKWQVLDWNEPAIKFYEKNEAIIEKEWWNGKIFLKDA